MMLSLVMRLAMITTLASCAGVPLAIAMNGPDPKALTIVTFDISGRKLLLPLPSSRMTKDLDEVRQPMATRIDIKNPHSASTKLLDDMWDWRSPLHLYGSIGIKLYVESTAQNFDLTCREALTGMLQARFVSGGKKIALPTFRDVPGIADGRAVSYRWAAFSEDQKGENDEESFAIALSPHEYLNLRVNYYGGGDPAIKPADWLPQAEAVKQGILQGIRFEGDWPELHNCGSGDGQH